MCDAIIALKPDLVITEKGVSGKQILSNRTKVSLTPARSCTAFPRQGQHYSYPPCPQDRQQPYRASHRCHYRQLRICRDSLRYWYTVWSVRDLQARRRVLHLSYKVQGPQGLHNLAPWSLKGHPERDRTQPARCHGRR
jgi:hypothetical protein